MRELPGRAARFTSRHAVLIVVCWVVVAGLANVLVPQLERVVASHSRSFMPASAASQTAATRAAERFGIVPSNNINYVVLERNQPLQPADRRYYDALMAALRSDTAHVNAVTDLWALPLTESAALSHDRHAANVMLRLSGMLGTSVAADAVDAVRHTVSRLAPPEGLHVYVTGPGATISDEFAAIDRQMLLITVATIAVILALLLIVYRSPIAAAVPLITVGLALAVARPLVAVLGQHGAVEVSLFSVALIAAMLLGAGTDYAIFMIGRYHEGRRRGIGWASALEQAYRGVAPVVVGSALTMAVALACLNLAKVGMFRSVGIPCAIGILAGMVAALTLTPALISLAGRRGLLEPRPSTIARRWRRIGVIVARWPGPVLVASGMVVLVLALPVAGLRPGWNEPAATPANADSSRGYQAASQHFPANQLFPDVVTVGADHDLRNPAGLIAVERISRQIMAIPGVRMVQSASRPAGTVPDEATLSHQAGLVGERFGAGIDSLVQRLQRVGDLDAMLSRMTATVDQLGRGMAGSAAGLGEISSGAEDMRAGMDGLHTSVSTVSEYLDPLRGFVTNTADCPANPICSVVARVVEPVDAVVRSSGELSSGAVKLTAGSGAATAGLAGLPRTLQSMRDVLGQARAATGELRDTMGSFGPQVRELTDYLRELDAGFRSSAAGGFYLPSRALSDPRYREVLKDLMSADGRATYLLVYGDRNEWGADGARRAEQVRTAVAEATKEGTLTPTEVDLAGVGPVTSDLQVFVAHDFRLLVVATLALIFLIVAVMLRSPVAAAAVMGTVIVSYASALAVSGLVCRHLLGQEMHWAVAPIAFIALVAVGADYNLLLAMRIREEVRAGIGTGIVRAFAGTGGVVTTAGVVFGITMFALMASTVQPVAQTGLTVGVGLLLDTLIVRTLLLPSLVALLNRWFWWPRRVTVRRTSLATRRERSLVSV
ncbi:putative membrane protein, MmpL family [Mycobacterium sp. MFM001]|uniref:MMPL/RND family transporter n=1 Tax=Mycobacterium sp. MFM001 TaxID=2049453 RepID=UPI000DA47377|nr:RND family transporter [Mycobacterium sp. MFM001]GBE67347.1 putative membrane protein, MmpL family [Mycobacterium sp. MFM001]